jgi:hypothetical protein
MGQDEQREAERRAQAAADWAAAAAWWRTRTQYAGPAEFATRPLPRAAYYAAIGSQDWANATRRATLAAIAAARRWHPGRKEGGHASADATGRRPGAQPTSNPGRSGPASLPRRTRGLRESLADAGWLARRCAAGVYTPGGAWRSWRAPSREARAARVRGYGRVDRRADAPAARIAADSARHSRR